MFVLLQALTLSTIVNQQGSPIPRQTGWFVTNSCACPYKYSHEPVQPQEMPSWLEELMNIVQWLCNPYGLKFNSCNINQYLGNKQCCGMHSDNEPLFNAVKSDACIASLSFGATRQFSVKNYATGLWSHKDLHDGDVCTMEGRFQKEFMHGALTQTEAAGIRYNLTFRTIVAHNPACRHSKEAKSLANSL